MSRFISKKHGGIVLLSLLLFLAACVPYLQTARFDFLVLDDDLYVTANPAVKEGLRPEGIRWAFRTFHSYNWHPLTWISHMADVSLFGMNPGGHHLAGVFFHGANTILLFLLLAIGTGAIRRSAFVAALFALHPLHVESVAWISERKDLLSAFFGFGCIALYFLYAKRKGRALYLAALLLYTLSLLSKPTLVTLPFLLLLLDYWPLERWGPPPPAVPAGGERKRKKTAAPEGGGSSTGRLLLEKAPFLGLALLSSVMTFLAQYYGGAVRSLDAIPLAVRVENALYSYVVYIWKTVWPLSLAVYYPHPMDLPDWPAMGPQALHLKAAAAAVFLAVLSILVFRAAKRRPFLVTGWLWYLLALVPMIGIVQVGSHAVADRYTYIPLVGLFIIAAWGVPDLLGGWRWKRVFLAASGGVVLAALAAITFSQMSHWKDSESLFRRAVDVVPGSALMEVNLGNVLLGKGAVDAAAAHYEAALEIRPHYGVALYFLGQASLRGGDTEKAAASFRRALAIPEDRERGYYPIGLQKAVNAHFQLGRLALLQGDVEGAEKHFAFVVKHAPEHRGDLYRELARALEGRGKTVEAEAYRKKAEENIPAPGPGKAGEPAGEAPGGR